MAATKPEKFSSLEVLNAAIVGCNLCPRLRGHSTEVARVRRKAYIDQQYWGRPVPSFGDPAARVLALGLAPGAHGSNRTGRPFTGDGSGDFLYPVLYDAGFASQSTSVSRDDGMRLIDCWITSVVRCAPPQNKPSRDELANCAPFLDREIALLPCLRVIVCLGRVAFDGYVKHMARALQLEARHAGPSRMKRSSGSVSGHAFSRAVDSANLIGLQPLGDGFRKSTGAFPQPAKPRSAFFHGAEYALSGGRYLLASFHPSLQNTNTGKLTRSMLLGVFERARMLANAGRH